MFAPTDKAMNNFPSESWKNLMKQEKVSLLHYHMVSKYYQFSTIMKTTNPIQTKASGSNGKPYTFNISATSMTKHHHQFNVSTEYPLQIFVVEEVLRPLDLFQNKNNTATTPSPPGEAPKYPTPPVQPCGAAEVLRAAEWFIGLVTMAALIL